MQLFANNITLQIIFCIVIGYLCGCFSTGTIVAKKGNVDIKHQGSGNTGATNVLRVMGPKAGFLTLGVDLFKTMLPILLVRFLFFRQYPAMSQMNQLLVLLVGFGAVLGHMFPFYLKFKGGKGVACMGACMLLYDWRLALVGFALFALTIYITKYMSIASMFASLQFPLFVLWSGYFNYGGHGLFYDFGDFDRTIWISMSVFTWVYTILCVYNHRANIKRLINHNENKFSFGPKKNK